MENNNKNNGPNKNRQGWGIILFTTLLVTFVVMGLYSMMQGGSASEISYDKFLKLVDNGKVESVTFTNSRINIVLTDDARKEKAEGKLTEVKDNELVGVRFPVEFGGLRKGELFLLPRPVHRDCPFRVPALSPAGVILPFPETG